jgi:hypothetical protein
MDKRTQGLREPERDNRLIGAGQQAGMGQVGCADICCAQRQSGKGVLRDVILRLRRKADNLQTVLNMLPEQPTPEQDQHLWELAQDLAG